MIERKSQFLFYPTKAKFSHHEGLAQRSDQEREDYKFPLLWVLAADTRKMSSVQAE